MIAVIIFITVVLSFLDTFFGNRIFPGKVEILKPPRGGYIIRKRTRFFFIPTWCYVSSINYNLKFYSRVIANSFGPAINASEFTDKEWATKVAMLFSNKLSKNYEVKKVLEESSVVWSSKSKISVSEKDLIPQLIEAVEKGDKERELRILKELDISGINGKRR